ncbi:hypothetical protein [Sandaracinobacteroides saxicola]|uniref:Uncharacterized protein n=1 Tax=Sandaracinobacteroides saxicola TaxID=2759707 RepID=A0A7G5IHV9_9SPHN|nr:hypothetical protein [Sandaracinobacteroides saxicola]QMW22951.1 hypothetical protein H3309_00075 [Sandaracinobacteroides saxicola]
MASAILMDKKKAVREQLIGAINMAFLHDNFISSYTLAWAALDLMRDLLKNEESKTILDRYLENWKTEGRKEVLKALRAPYNFSKHADRDADKIIDMPTRQNCSLIILFCCWFYETTYGKRTLEMMFFSAWFMANNRKMIEPEFLVGLETPMLRYEGDGGIQALRVDLRQCNAEESYVKTSALALNIPDLELQ